MERYTWCSKDDGEGDGDGDASDAIDHFVIEPDGLQVLISILLW